MYPQLFNQAARLAPMLSRVMGRGAGFATPFWKVQQIDTPDVNAKPMPPKAPGTGAWAPDAPSVPISDGNSAPASTAAAPMLPPWVNGQMFNGLGFPAAPAPQPAPAPMPRMRPQDAPQATSIPEPSPDTGFFMRNALMMQDPNGGGLIDPTGAASVKGPDLIAKMMSYLHNKVS